VRQTKPDLHWLSVGQFAFSGLALLGLFGLVVLLGITALSGAAQTASGQSDLLSVQMRTAGLVLVAILLLPSLVLSFLRMVGIRPPTLANLHLLAGRSYRVALTGIALVWVVAWLLSTQVFQNSDQLWPLAPPLFLLVTGLPIAFWFLLGAHGLPGGSFQRRWGLLAASIAGSTLVILLVEILALIAVVILVAVAIASRPEWAAQMSQIARQLSNAQLDPETVTRILKPYLTQPWVIFLVIGVASGLVPLIEEALKPLAAWLLAGKRITPAEGFVAGLICGAGFTLFESLGMLSTFSGETWPAMALGRAGTDLLHMTTSSMLGWALASAWRDGKYGRLGLVYLGAAATHGLWNLVSLSSSILPTLEPLPSPALRWLQDPVVANAAIGLLVLLLLVLLLTLSNYLRAHQPASLVESNQTPGGVTF
jgi:hypothetical protein